MQRMRAVDRKTNLEVFLEVPVRTVVEDNGFIGLTVAFDSAGGGKAPFHEGGAADEGDVVEVDYLFLSMISCTSMEGVCMHVHTLRTNSNRGYPYQLDRSVLYIFLARHSPSDSSELNPYQQ